MKMELNIYKYGKVIKTYEAETFVLTTGTCADLINVAEESNLVEIIMSGDKDEVNLGVQGLQALYKAFPKITPLLTDIFEGLTEEEVRKTDILEVGQLVVDIFTYAINNLFTISKAKKN